MSALRHLGAIHFLARQKRPPFHNFQGSRIALLKLQQMSTTPPMEGVAGTLCRKAEATGRRKTSAARVFLSPGSGIIHVNNTAFSDYFQRPTHRKDILEPLVATNTLGKWDVRCFVKGGGVSGQAQATRHAISLAMRKANPQFTSALRAKGLTTRDPRMVERKKPGQPKARKKFQWVKR